MTVATAAKQEAGDSTWVAPVPTDNGNATGVPPPGAKKASKIRSLIPKSPFRKNKSARGATATEQKPLDDVAEEYAAFQAAGGETAQMDRSIADR